MMCVLVVCMLGCWCSRLVGVLMFGVVVVYIGVGVGGLSCV